MTESTNDEALRYPIGRFARADVVTPELRQTWIETLAAQPERLRAAVAGMSDEQLDTPYRDGGWTVRQVVHHIADTNTVLGFRARMVAAEPEPPLLPFDENLWAELPDARTGPIEPSLLLLDGMHGRLAALLRSLSDEQWARVGQHPVGGPTRLDRIVELYTWHGDHHIAHITSLKERRGW